LRGFWSSIVVMGYAYAGFPVLLWARARLFPRPHVSAEIQPSVTVVIAAHNEASIIRQRLDNLVSLDYPMDSLDVIVASDGSDDGTDEIVASYRDSRISLLSLPRRGKAHALNSAVARARGEILVFSDANSMYAPRSIRALVRPFADPDVGGVAGDQQYADVQEPGEGGERSYWGYDRMLKRWESAAGSVVQATGAIYSIRRSLFRPVPEGVSDDFVTSVGVIEQGYRLVFAPDAVAYEPVAPSSGAEFRRKVRIGTRMLRSEFHVRALLNPLRHGFYSVELLSHKPLRRLMAFPVLVIGLSSGLLWRQGWIYRASAIAQICFYATAAFGLVAGESKFGRHRLVALPAYFCMVYAAQLVAVWNILRGHRIALWKQDRTP